MQADNPRHLWRLTLAITTCATVFTAMQGLTFPLLALILERMDTPEWAIGVNAAMMPLGLMLSATIAPALLRRHGGFALAATALVTSAACVLALGASMNALVWMPLRLLMGIALGCILVVTETWINEVTTDDRRGRVVGFYSAILSAGFAFGPLLLIAVGSHGWAPFLIGSMLPLLAVLPLARIRHDLPAPSADGGTVTAGAFLRMAPLLLLCTAAVALADEGAMSFLPLFALGYGYSEQAGTALLIVMIAGSITMQYPIGWLADHIRRSTVIIGCATAAAVSAALFPVLAPSTILLAMAVFVWGGTYYAIYVLSLVRLGETYRGTALVAGNAAFAAMWGIGGIGGTSIVGGSMSLLGPAGFPVVFVLIFAAIAVSVAYLSRRELEPDSCR